MQVLVDAGQLTQPQCDALCADASDKLMAKLMANAGTNSAIQTALSTLSQARATMEKALRDAGIERTARVEGGLMAGRAMKDDYAARRDANERTQKQRGMLDGPR